MSASAAALLSATLGSFITVNVLIAVLPKLSFVPSGLAANSPGATPMAQQDQLT